VSNIVTEPENAYQFTEWLNQPEAGPSSYVWVDRVSQFLRSLAQCQQQKSMPGLRLPRNGRRSILWWLFCFCCPDNRTLIVWPPNRWSITSATIW
jgi:hypothetical protein